MQASDIAPIVEPLLAEHGLELDDVQIIPAGKRAIVRISVDGDGPTGRGPLLDDIARASQDISAALDEADFGNHAYTLEVSSRGLGKPLTKPSHWRRNRGRLVSLRVADEAITGRIMASDDTSVTLDVHGLERVFPIAEALKALVQVEMNRPADPELDAVEIGGVEDDDGEGDLDEVHDEQEDEK